MNTNETLTRLRQMRLSAMAQLHKHHHEERNPTSFTADEYLSYLVDSEWEHRYNRKIERLIATAGFRQKASLAQVTYAGVSRTLDQAHFTRLAGLGFLTKAENIIITGSTGVGKSFLGQALGHHCCLHQHKVFYSPTTRLMNSLKLSKLDGSYLKELAKLAKMDLLILDDFGLHGFDSFARSALMDIVDERHGRSSMIIISQFPVSTWHELIGENTLADAILDRIINSSHRLELQGESMRKGKIDTN